MSTKIKVKAKNAVAGKDGGFPVLIWDKDDRHEGGELFIADDEVHTVESTAAVAMALAEGRLMEVRSETKESAAPDKKDK